MTALIWESVQAFAYLTRDRSSIPGPEIYDMLGNLKLAAYGLAGALDQISLRLGKSLVEYDLYEDDYGDPAVSIARTSGQMLDAAQHAHEVGSRLELAQNLISRQGYHDRKTRA